MHGFNDRSGRPTIRDLIRDVHGAVAAFYPEPYSCEGLGCFCNKNIFLTRHHVIYPLFAIFVLVESIIYRSISTDTGTNASCP
jgi:hypothetical protein